MTTTDEVMAFLAAGSATKSCSFLEKGTTYEGPIVSMAIRQDSDLQSGELKTWADGSPKNVLVIGIQTDEVDPDDDDDDGVRTLWAKFKMLEAIKKAVKDAGAKLEIGGVLSVTFTKQDKPAKRGFSGIKHYEATYEAPDPVADFIEEADDDEAPAPKRKAKAAAKRRRPAPVEDDEDDVDEDDDDDDDEPPFEPKRRAKPAAKAAPGKRRRSAPVEDDEDEAF